jgi:hypothetical protein
MFSEKEMSDMKFSRRILFADEKIMIDDTIDSGNRQLDGHLSSGFSTRYFPSSMFFQINSINNKVHTCSVHDNGKFTLHRELDFS